MESSLYGHEDDPEELREESSACAFFCFPCPLRGRHGGPEHRSLLRGEPRGDARWEERARRATELLSRLGGLLRRLRGRGGGRRRRPQFQYDPVSYALNFDDGAGREEAAERAFLRYPADLPTKDSCL